ncbi:MAG: hypothetical protein J6Y62_00545 [Clostridia bacterium]|nr:hypothetical protein [Clostridia bacterium]
MPAASRTEGEGGDPAVPPREKEFHQYVHNRAMDEIISAIGKIHGVGEGLRSFAGHEEVKKGLAEAEKTLEGVLRKMKGPSG